MMQVAQEKSALEKLELLDNHLKGPSP